MSQTSYSLNQGAGVAGLIYDIRPDRIEGYAVEGATIPFGYGVVAGTDLAAQVRLPSADTDTFRGLAAKTHTVEQGLGTGETGYRVGDCVNTVREGAIWCVALVAVAIDDDAYVVAAGTDAGKLTNVAGGNIATGGKFRTATATANELAVVEIDL